MGNCLLRLNWLQKTAYHEAGHCLFAIKFGLPFKYVTIRKKDLPPGQVGGVFGIDSRYILPPGVTKAEALEIVKPFIFYLLSGPGIEGYIQGLPFRFGNTGKLDYIEFKKICRDCRLNKIEIDEIIRQVRQEIKDFIDLPENFEILKATGKALLKKLRLEYDEVIEITRLGFEAELFRPYINYGKEKN